MSPVDFPYRLELVTELQGHGERAWHIAWNPVKPLLASCSADKTVRMYRYDASGSDAADAQTYYFTHKATIPTEHSKTVRAIAWSPSGNTLATASFDSHIGIWEQEAEGEDHHHDIEGGWECMSLLEGHETECKSVAYSPAGTLLASCSRDKTVYIWEVHPDSDFECASVLMEHSQDVKCVAWHPYEEILASASYDDTIKLYYDDPLEDWYCFTTLTGHTSTVWSLAWSPNGKYLASSSEDCTIRIWKRVENHKWESALVLQGHERSIYSISWGRSKNAQDSVGWLASTGGDGRINVWQINENLNNSVACKGTINADLIASISSAHDASDVNAISWCPRPGCEGLLSTAGDDFSVRVWRIVPA